MTIPMAAADVLNREFFEIRAKLLEVAASLDRLDRAAGSVNNDARMSGIRRALEILQQSDDDRAEQIQLLFSREYDDAWQKEYGIEIPR